MGFYGLWVSNIEGLKMSCEYWLSTLSITDKQDSAKYVQNTFDQLLVIKCLIN